MRAIVPPSRPRPTATPLLPGVPGVAAAPAPAVPVAVAAASAAAVPAAAVPVGAVSVGARMLVALLVVALPAVAGCRTDPRADPAPSVTASAADASRSADPQRADPSPAASPSPVTPAISYPRTGSGTHLILPGGGPVLGTAGTLMRFQIAVEREVANVDPGELAAFVERTFADPGGWTAGGRWRFQQVGPGEASSFTLYFVTPGTRDAYCGGRDGFTNCRNGARVVINMDRWTAGVPDYGAPLETYRRYVINHEVGHRLGEWHELCPGPGRPAPLMQQQTLGLHGCVANAWPYLNGQRYRGAPGTYGS
jgi:hypothetical protein